MPLLRLTLDEARDLKLALEVRVQALGIELGGTDTREYRAILSSRLERLEAILARIDEDPRPGSHAEP
jgi:hypothetical protein